MRHAARWLMAWLSPALPIGAFTYSHGLEWAVEAGHVLDRADLVRWVEAILEHGAGRTDAVLFAAAYRAVKAGDEPALSWVAERADVLRGSSELALESTAQGDGFPATVTNTWPPDGLARWAAVLAATGRPPAHAVAVAVVTACARACPWKWPWPLPARLRRQSGLGGAAARSARPDRRAARAAALGRRSSDRAAVGALDAPDRRSRRLRAPLIDWAAMAHETQYTRLFRS